jgi:Zn-dependent protease/predicted transcriptional regulator
VPTDPRQKENKVSEAATKNGPQPSSPTGTLATGLRVGRVAGVEIRLHWTWLLAAVFITASLAGGVFPSEVGGLSTGAYLAMGLVTALLFFVSLLLHELGHAVQARREGIPTRGITLWMLGGVARSGGPFRSAGQEARVALAGPAVSAALAAALVGAGQIGGLPAAIAAVLEWLGWTNLLLLAFNMIPALPLDGGRVLRAALWRLSGSLLRATTIASRLSQAVAVVLICLGAASLLVGASLGGLWLAFIGSFVFSAATAERGGAEAQIALAGVQVAELMTPDPMTVSASASAGELLELRRRTGHSVYPVIDEHGDAVGLISVGAAERLPEHRRAWVTVRELVAAGPDPLAIDAEAEALAAIPALVGNPLHRAAVLHAGRLVGLLALSDVTRAVRLRVGGAVA